jgi:rod shape determining protein RodA
MGSSLMFGPRKVTKSIPQKFKSLNWAMILLLASIAGVGFAMQFSVGGGNWEPWASTQMMRFGIALVLMLIIAFVDLSVWMALAYPAFIIGLLMLVAVEFFGTSGMGGQRWLDIGFMRIQPSELMKVAMVMALARYYHGLSMGDSQRLRSIIWPLILMAIPAFLVLKQPDLGTTIMLVAGGISIIFLAGLPSWIIWASGFIGVMAIPIGWRFLLDYQKERILTFLNPERDPLGAGYQITQAKIAAGSGGVFGKGYMAGTQSHLNFLPEMKTDFIFTVLLEEFGLMGGLFVLNLYLVVLGYGVWVSLSCRSQFGRLLAMGLSITLFLYVFINISMVMGLLPVVGVPLPMISYGGSAMLTMMIAYGLILSVSLNREVNLARKDPFG